MLHFTKLCADNLRVLSAHHGVKLKASHAHELVASYFGYKSRADLLADTQYPVNLLQKSSFITLAPIVPLDPRRRTLQNLPPELPDTDTLREWFYCGLLSEKWFASKFWPNYEKLAIFLADGYLRENQMDKVYRFPMKQVLQVERLDDCMRLTISRCYQIHPEKILLIRPIYEENIIITIQFQRIAGHIGYAKPEISVQKETLK